MKINIPVEIYDTDYVLINMEENKPVENDYTIYAAESVIELINDGFALGRDEQFVKMTNLPLELLKKYARSIFNSSLKCIS